MHSRRFGWIVSLGQSLSLSDPQMLFLRDTQPAPALIRSGGQGRLSPGPSVGGLVRRSPRQQGGVGVVRDQASCISARGRGVLAVVGLYRTAVHIVADILQLCHTLTLT